MRYLVGDLVVDVGRQSVSRSDVDIALPKLSYDLLLALVRAAPNLVSLDELMHQVWLGVVVSPETVSKRVTLLRDALGEDSRAPRYIAGLRGRGYRILSDVSVVADSVNRESTESGSNANVDIPPPDTDKGSASFLTVQTRTASINAEREAPRPDRSFLAAVSKSIGLSSMSVVLLATAGIALSATGLWYIWSQARASLGNVDVTPNLFAGTWVGKLETCSPSTTYSGPFTVAISNTNSEILHLVYYGYGSDGSLSLTGSYDLRAMGRRAESVSLPGITYILKEQDLIVNYPKICQNGILHRQDPQVQSVQSVNLANQH